MNAQGAMDDGSNDSPGPMPARILVVDDSRLIRTMVAGTLDAAGYTVDEADGGPAALTRLEGHAYDVVVTDLGMPRPDGFEILETVRRRSLGSEVIILTGTHASDIDAAVRALRLGAHDYLTKPLSGSDQLLLAVERALATGRQRQALRAAEARYRQLFDEMPIGLYRESPDGRFLDVNPALVEILGYPSREALLAVNARAVEMDGGDRPAWREQVERDGQVRHVEQRLQRHDGRPVWVERTARIHRNANGEPAYLDGSLQDISLRKAAEDELREALRMEAVGRLAGGVAHHYNNLLGIIMGAADLIEGQLRPGGKARGDLGKIRTAAERAATLTRQLLAFGRRQALRPRVVDLNAIVAESEAALGALLGETVVLEKRLDAAPISVRVDPDQVRQVMLNLAANARDAMPRGGSLTIETACERTNGPREGARLAGWYARLSLSDTGHGMDAHTRERIFEPYFTTKDRTRAAGLGLATVYGIVTQSGGYLNVETEMGGGSRFDVFLPLQGRTADRRESGSTTDELQPGRETILLVEDEDELRRMLRRGLKRAGYHVIDAPDGRAALDVAGPRLAEIDAVISDLIMPHANGVDLASHLRAGRPDLAILFISGHADSEPPTHGPLARRCAFLRKPFTVPALTRALRALLDAPEEGPAAAAPPGAGDRGE